MIKKFLRDNSIHKKIAPLLDVFFIIPIIHFFAIWGILCLGIGSANNHFIGYPASTLTTNFTTILLFISVSFMYSANTLYEFYFNKNESFSNKILVPDLDSLSIKTINYICRVFYLISILISLMINWRLTPLYFLLSILTYFLAFKRSNKPDWTINDFLIYSISITTTIFLIGWSYLIIQNDIIRYFSIIEFVKIYFPYLLSFISISLILYIRYLDVKGYFLDRKIPLISMLFLLISILFSLFNKDPLISVSSIVSLPFFLYAGIRHLEKDISRAFTYSIFIHIFFSFTIFPLFTIPIIILFYFCKYYNWHRYNIHYPAFVIDNDSN